MTKLIINKFKFIPFHKLKEWIETKQYETLKNDYGLETFLPVAFFEGDLHIEDNFDVAAFGKKAFTENKNLANSADYKCETGSSYYDNLGLIYISGNLSIGKTIHFNSDNENHNEWLFVEKNLTAKNIIINGFNLRVEGKTTVSQILYTQMHAQGTCELRGEKDIFIYVDEDFGWTKGNKTTRINKETSLANLEKIWICPEDYFTDRYASGNTEPDYELEYSQSEQLIQDIIADKPIFWLNEENS